MVRVSKKYGNKLTADSDLKELFKIRQFIKNHATCCGFNDSTAEQIALAVDEACTNLIKHAYFYEKGKRIHIEVDFETNQLVVKIKDDGNPFNPIEVTQPDMLEYLKKFNRGGLGIPIIHKIMDEILYLPSDNTHNFNILTLKKSLDNG